MSHFVFTNPKSPSLTRIGVQDIAAKENQQYLPIGVRHLDDIEYQVEFPAEFTAGMLLEALLRHFGFSGGWELSYDSRTGAYYQLRASEQMSQHVKSGEHVVIWMSPRGNMG